MAKFEKVAQLLALLNGEARHVAHNCPQQQRLQLFWHARTQHQKDAIVLQLEKLELAVPLRRRAAAPRGRQQTLARRDGRRTEDAARR